MAYTRFLGKRVIAGNKFVTGYAEPPALFEGWTNVSWESFTPSGFDILNATTTSDGVDSWAVTEIKYFNVGERIRIYVSEFTIHYGVYPTNTANIHLVENGLYVVQSTTLNPATVPRYITFEIDVAGNYALRFQNYNKNHCQVDAKMYSYLQN